MKSSLVSQSKISVGPLQEPLSLCVCVCMCVCKRHLHQWTLLVPVIHVISTTYKTGGESIALLSVIVVIILVIIIIFFIIATSSSTKSVYLIKCSYTFYLNIFTISGLMLFTYVCTSVAPFDKKFSPDVILCG